nr:hypothetical protein [Tanacetum cinerariifolium]
MDVKERTVPTTNIVFLKDQDQENNSRECKDSNDPRGNKGEKNSKNQLP